LDENDDEDDDTSVENKEVVAVGYWQYNDSGKGKGKGKGKGFGKGKGWYDYRPWGKGYWHSKGGKGKGKAKGKRNRSEGSDDQSNKRMKNTEPERRKILDTLHSVLKHSREAEFQERLGRLAADARDALASILDCSPAAPFPGSPIRALLLGALLKACGYPHEGAILEHEIAQGFALGHHVPAPPSTLWPKAKKHPPVDCRRVFENYRSAEEHPDKLSTILQSEVLSGRMELVDEDSAGSAVITPVALIPKADCPKDPSLQKAEHFRVIEDYRRSHRNCCG
ncbi:hypothetical protein FOL46_000404, partial [Perkinsus olseni]